MLHYHIPHNGGRSKTKKKHFIHQILFVIYYIRLRTSNQIIANNSFLQKRILYFIANELLLLLLLLYSTFAFNIYIVITANNKNDTLKTIKVISHVLDCKNIFIFLLCFFFSFRFFQLLLFHSFVWLSIVFGCVVNHSCSWNQKFYFRANGELKRIHRFGLTENKRRKKK